MKLSFAPLLVIAAASSAQAAQVPQPAPLQPPMQAALPWDPAAPYITVGQDEPGYRSWYLAAPWRAAPRRRTIAPGRMSARGTRRALVTACLCPMIPPASPLQSHVIEAPDQMPRSHQGPQQVCKLLAQCRDIVSLRLEKLEERAQTGRGQRGITAVIGRLPMHQLVHASAEVFRVRQALIGFATQALTPRRLYAS